MVRIAHAHFFAFKASVPIWLARPGGVCERSCQWRYVCDCGAVCIARPHINRFDPWEVVSFERGIVGVQECQRLM